MSSILFVFILKIITPILCLGFIALIKLIIESQMGKIGLGLQIQVPLIFNLPIYNKLIYTNQSFKVNSCNEVSSSTYLVVPL